MSDTPIVDHPRPKLNLASEFWQMSQLVICRHHRNAEKKWESVPMCTVHHHAFNSYIEARQAMRLIQAAPELLRLLKSVCTMGTPDREREAAFADANVLIDYLQKQVP